MASVGFSSATAERRSHPVGRPGSVPAVHCHWWRAPGQRDRHRDDMPTPRPPRVGGNHGRQGPGDRLRVPDARPWCTDPAMIAPAPAGTSWPSVAGHLLRDTGSGECPPPMSNTSGPPPTGRSRCDDGPATPRDREPGPEPTGDTDRCGGSGSSRRRTRRQQLCHPPREPDETTVTPCRQRGVPVPGVPPCLVLAVVLDGNPLGTLGVLDRQPRGRFTRDGLASDVDEEPLHPTRGVDAQHA